MKTSHNRNRDGIAAEKKKFTLSEIRKLPETCNRSLAQTIKLHANIISATLVTLLALRRLHRL